MNDFFKAAFPWIVIGIALALLAANHANQKKKREQNADNSEGKEQENHLLEGMYIGMCMGVVLGTTGICDLGTGISLGLLLGEAVGFCIKK